MSLLRDLRIAALRAGADAIERDEKHRRWLTSNNAIAFETVDALRTSRARLRVALARYGRHEEECAWMRGYATCTCGLDAARGSR